MTVESKKVIEFGISNCLSTNFYFWKVKGHSSNM